MPEDLWRKLQINYSETFIKWWSLLKVVWPGEKCDLGIHTKGHLYTQKVIFDPASPGEIKTTETC